MYDIDPRLYTTVIREMIRHENDVTNHRIMCQRNQTRNHQPKLMKKNTLSVTPLALLSAGLVTFASCSSTPPPAVGSARITYTKGVPGGVIVQTFKTTATVTEIDQAKRTATLQRSGGMKFMVKAAPEAVNFDQVHVGDQVNATVAQKIVAHLDKENIASDDGAAAVVSLAPKADQPGRLVAENTQVTGKIIAIDTDRRTATLRFEDGSTETLPVRDDVDLSRRKVGEQVVFRVTEMIAIWVEKAQ